MFHPRFPLRDWSVSELHIQANKESACGEITKAFEMLRLECKGEHNMHNTFAVYTVPRVPNSEQCPVPMPAAPGMAFMQTPGS